MIGTPRSPPSRPKVLVTGADQHQGLAVVRGLGLAGYPVVACGPSPRSLAFYSRYAVETGRYTSPSEDKRRFVRDVVDIARRTRPALILPVVESTLAALAEAREEVECHAKLGAPDSAVLEYALNRVRAFELARRFGVPAPRTIRGETAAALLERAAELEFPVAVKPQGHGPSPPVGYATSLDELGRVLEPLGAHARAVLVQECTGGVTRCVAAVCRHGDPMALFAYARLREFPPSGGVSVMRRSIPVDPPAARHVTMLLGALRWHGVAMVEFKYDAATDRYTLTEINGRFHASTALALDAGLNLPELTVRLYTDGTAPPPLAYRIGVEERWLRGDLLALLEVLDRGSANGGPSRARALWGFLRDFRPGVKYDEFRWNDWRPAVRECGALAGVVGRWLVGARG